MRTGSLPLAQQQPPLGKLENWKLPGRLPSTPDEERSVRSHLLFYLVPSEPLPAQMNYS